MWKKWRRFVLRRRRSSEHFAGGRLVIARLGARSLKGVQNTIRSKGIDLQGGLARDEADADVALGGEVVNLIGLALFNRIPDAAHVGEVRVHQLERTLRVAFVVGLQKMVHPLRVRVTGSSHCAAHGVSFGKKQLSQI